MDDSFKPIGFVPSLNAMKQPDGNLKISYVHGFNNNDKKMMARYCTSGNFVFVTAALGVKQYIDRKQ